MSRLLLIWVQKPFSQREGETNTSIMIFPTKTSNIDGNLSDQKLQGTTLEYNHNTHTRFTNTVQYLVQACRPTGELTTEHELVRSVVPSTSVSWCVWHIDHARHYGTLTRVSQVASQTVTLHAQDTFTVLHYHHIPKIYVRHTSSIIIQFWMDNDRMNRIHSMWWMTWTTTMSTAKCAKP
jgi:hypothetical protein